MAATSPIMKVSFSGVCVNNTHRRDKISPTNFATKFKTPIKTLNSLSSHNPITHSAEKTHKLVHEFDPKIPVEEAVTPPSSWYTDPSFYTFELDHVFYKGWQVVGYTDQIRDTHSYFTGRLGNVEYVVCRDGDGKIHAFHNVCRHHASVLAYGCGKKTCFVCPYHRTMSVVATNAHTLELCNQGWTYGLKGNLLTAPRTAGLQKFDPEEFGLIPIKVETWGPFIVAKLNTQQHEFDNVDWESDWLGSCSELLTTGGVDSSLSYICRREYTIECNWKVFCDNYLDGGYHVPYAHRNLASGLSLDGYSTEIFERVSIQRCTSSLTKSEGDFDRLGSKALYAFVYPNFMINRYGPWMDTNLVLSLGPRKCQVIFDYYLDPSLKDDDAFIEKSLKESEQVQMEDIMLCEGVQRGLESPVYQVGRYAPTVEQAMHHFHCLLYTSLAREDLPSPLAL